MHGIWERRRFSNIFLDENSSWIFRKIDQKSRKKIKNCTALDGLSEGIPKKTTCWQLQYSMANSYYINFSGRILQSRWSASYGGSRGIGWGKEQEVRRGANERRCAPRFDQINFRRGGFKKEKTEETPCSSVIRTHLTSMLLKYTNLVIILGQKIYTNQM